MKNLGVKLNKIKDFAKANKKVVSCVFVALLCFAFLFFGGMSGVKNAFVGLQKFFAGNEEIAGKDYTDNENGTYTLELSVTGAADTNVSKVDNVNVVIVYDRSNSMTRSVETGSSRTRAQEAEAIVTDFIQKLFTYQDSQHPENIQVSLITFAQCATQVSIGGNTWSSNETQITNAIDAITYNNRALGTNWYDALKTAETLVMIQLKQIVIQHLLFLLQMVLLLQTVITVHKVLVQKVNHIRDLFHIIIQQDNMLVIFKLEKIRHCLVFMPLERMKIF